MIWYSVSAALGGCNQHVSVFIGADQYHGVVVGEVIKSSPGPAAFSSKFGWLLSGRVAPYKNSSNIVSNLVLDIVPTREEVFNESK